ncbi:MAG: M20/M25/M40 family metallo-hydrolase [Brevundimonas sp.]|uniref:M20/M25/M40 family metallo-hydrolase n=1 Tax=Brevundimonas sp. TaxID=1871086 RepID=UPI0025BEF4EA|nr:M20/M25/M40 family metallo-hydrolase [Brevundimonas sp.]MBX3478268.1 M20/M25/M40 family metallo-hydrolase [Brevundimonas sp.]
MTRLALLIGSLVVALALAATALQTPMPRGLDAEATQFSAVRALADVRQIARAPHPVGSAEHGRTQAYLTARMARLGLSPEVQAGPLSPAAIRRLDRWGLDPAAADHQAHNLVGVLPGRDPSLRPTLLMAHYDSVPGSPGAADDAAGVAAALEIVRAIRARGPAQRDLVVLFTDGEELNLDGARVFFGGHPLRDRIGAVINLEARGGGGRAFLFETGVGGADSVARFAHAARQAPGGPSASSLAAFVYGLMPNGTDFTIARDRGLPGLNLAFIGRPDQYHAPTSTPAALEAGSLQHIGGLGLEAVDAWLRGPDLTGDAAQAVYADVLGLALVRHAPAGGWILLGLAAVLGGFAAWVAHRRAGLRLPDVGRGLLDGLWLAASGVVVARGVRALGGPMTSRIESVETYQLLLRRLPWMEAGVVLALLAVCLVLMAGRDRAGRRVTTAILGVLTLASIVLGGFDPVVIGAAAAAIGLSWMIRREPGSVWGGWLGLIALVFVLACAAQAAAPQAALLLVWPVLLAALAASLAATLSAGLIHTRSLAPAAVATALGGGWLAAVGHQVWLGVGMDLPGALALIALLILMLARPLAPRLSLTRPFLIAAAACLVVGCGLSAWARAAEPAAVAAAPPAA